MQEFNLSALAEYRPEKFVIYEGGTETLLKTISLYYGGVAPVFGIPNRVEGPFQMLVLLVSAAAPAE